MYPETSPPPKTKRPIFFALAGLVVCLIIGFILVQVIGGKKDTPSTATTKNVVPPEPKTATLYAGDTALTEGGISVDQLEGMRFAFQKYYGATKQTPESYVKLTNVTFKLNGPEADFNTVYFDTVLYNKPLKVQMDYAGLYDVHLYFRDSAGAIAFDSGTVNLQSGDSELPTFQAN